MSEKKSYFEKVKEHKTKIIIAGVTIASIAGVILLTKNWDIIKDKTVTVFLKQGAKIKVEGIPAVQTAVESVVEIEAIEKIVDVSKHLRTLPTGHNASLAKILTASENGFQLEIGQTWVEEYSKMCA